MAILIAMLLTPVSIVFGGLVIQFAGIRLVSRRATIAGALEWLSF